MKQSIRTEIIIHSSKEKVWQILTNFREYALWNPFIVKSEGKAEVGSRLKNTMLNNGKERTFRPKVLKAEPNQSLEWLGSLWVRGLFDGHHYFYIEDIGNGQVKFTQGENFSGLLVGPIMNAIGEDTRNNFVRFNNALKKRAEGRG